MKILIISEFFPTGKDLKFSGGVESRNFYLAKYLSKKHKVSILTRRLYGTKKREKIYGFDVFRVGPSVQYSASFGDLLGRVRFVVAAINYGKKLEFEIVEGTNYLTHFIAKILGIRCGKPTVAWYPDLWLGRWVKITGLMGIFGEILERINLALGFSAYIAISKEVFKKLRPYSKNLHLVLCGVEFSEFKKNHRKFPNPTIISISRLTKYKNLNVLLFAFAHLSTKLKGVRLIIVGAGPELKKLKEITKNLKIHSKVTFLSNLERKRLINLIASSHIFSLPSFVEGFGIATIEAAAAGLPYVISDIPTHREVTKNGLGGFLVEPKSPLAYSQKLEKLLTNKALYLKKSKEARNLAKNYNWLEIARRTEKVYQLLVKAKQ